jgi:PKD repeat protein
MCVGVATMVAGVVGASPASASTTTRTASTAVSGTTQFQNDPLTQTSLSGVDLAVGGLDAKIDWQQPTTLSTQYDTDAVRQGRAVDPVDSATRTIPGTLVANWSVTDLMVTYGGYFPFDVGSIGLSSTGTCNLTFGGGAYVCHLESTNSTILDSSPDPGPYVNAKLVADFTITPQALATLRSASLAGNPAGTANLQLGTSPVTDSLSVPCAAGAGDDLSYSLGTLSTTPGIDVQASLALQVGTSVANPNYPLTDPNPVIYLPPLASPSFPFADVSTSMAMTGNGATFDFGGVQADDQPVNADAGGPYSGTEGAPIGFAGSGTTAGCGTPTLHWDFGDGGSADGASPTHAYADNGTYTGTLTATDGARSTTVGFSVTVTNAPPVANAGPDASAGVNQVVTFAGSATDPSSVDQASLTYSWNFGDTSVTAATATPTHQYSAPGTYTATLTVCDKDGACSSDARQITVAANKPTLLLYFGDFLARERGSVDVRAIVVDRTLHPVVGRTVTFTLGTQTVSATTDSRGIAASTLKLTQRRGLYALTASFSPAATENAYAGSSMTVPFLIFP